MLGNGVTKACYALLVVSVFLPHVLPASILFFIPGGNLSHKTGMWPWVLELAKRGHNITYISPHAKTISPHSNIADFAPDVLSKMSGHVYQVDRFKDRDQGQEKNTDYVKTTSDACKAIIDNRDSDPVFKKLFSQSSFDLVIVNAVYGECAYYIGHYFKAKTILFSPCSFLTWHYDVYGITPETAWVPDLIYTAKNIPMTFWDRVVGVWVDFYWTWKRTILSSRLQKVTEPLLGVGNTPNLYDLENNVSVVLVNSHPSMDFPKTFPPMIIDVGGMGTTSSSKEKEMPKNFKDFMDTAGPSGIVLISFGSTVLLNSVSTRFQAMFFHLIHEFPNVKFLMRWSGPMPKFLDSPPKNLMVSDWLPQQQIMSHPNLKLFITHGGISSIQEATYNGVPMIVIPLFADQDYNAIRIETQELGLSVEIRDLTEDSLVNVVDKVLKDDKYKKNMMKKSAIFRDRPLKPVDTAVYWTEYALRHDDIKATFRSPNQHLNAFQRRLLDVYLFFLTIAILAISAIVSLIKIVLKLISLLRSSKPSRGRSNKVKTK